MAPCLLSAAVSYPLSVALTQYHRLSQFSVGTSPALDRGESGRERTAATHRAQ